MLVIKGAYIRGAYIRDFTLYISTQSTFQETLKSASVALDRRLGRPVNIKERKLRILASRLIST